RAPASAAPLAAACPRAKLAVRRTSQPAPPSATGRASRAEAGTPTETSMLACHGNRLDMLVARGRLSRRRRIVLWSFRGLPSFRMRGRQVGRALEARGHAVELRTGFGFLALPDVRDAIVVLVKDQPSRMSALSRNGNRVVFDAVDFAPDRHELG